MALKSALQDREFLKFVETSSGNHAVRVATDASDPLDVSGTFAPGGLSDSIRITTMDVTDVAAPIPATALTNRATISILNTDTTEILYIGNATVTADNVVGTTSGDEVGPGNKFAIDLAASVVLYGIAPAGKTIRVKVLEIA